MDNEYAVQFRITLGTDDENVAAEREAALSAALTAAMRKIDGVEMAFDGVEVYRAALNPRSRRICIVSF